MTEEDDYILLSALQHLLFCPRQFALIHVEGLWAENRLTAQGRLLHRRVDSGFRERRRDRTKHSDSYLCSHAYGIRGKADVVEVVEDSGGAVIRIPVEYKRGKRKWNSCDAVQLCAQALCIEEMCSCAVPYGFFYYQREGRRIRLDIDDALRTETVNTINEAHRLLNNHETPHPIMNRKCRNCSMRELCLPTVINKKKISYYLGKIFEKTL